MTRGRAARPRDHQSLARRKLLENQAAWTTDQITERIRTARDAAGIGNPELRRRLGVLGWDVTRDGLAGLLMGSRKRRVFPVHEVVYFAGALGVTVESLIPPERWEVDWEATHDG